MAATTKAYGNFAQHLARGRINWAKTGGSLIKCALMANTYTPDQDAHASWADVKEHEASGTGYTAGGSQVGLLDTTYDAGTNTLHLDAENVTWGSLCLTARYAVLYAAGVSDDASWLIACTDFGVDKAPCDEPLWVLFDEAGVITITVSA